MARTSAASVAQNVNQQLLDASIRHSHYLQRYGGYEVQQVLTFLNEQVLPDLLTQYHKMLMKIDKLGYDPSPKTTKRIEDMIGSTHDVLRGGLESAGQDFYNDMKKFALSESEWQVAYANRYLQPAGISIAMPNVTYLDAVVTSRPMQGRIMKDWWAKVGESAREDIEKATNIGLAQGESIGKITQRITGTNAFNYEDGVFGRLRRNVESTVRTAANHVSSQARQATFEDNTDIISGVQYVATLDSRTTMTCAALDGKVFPIDSGPRPPQHWNCRSTIIPIIKSWKELGIPMKELPGSVRASMDGEVPAKQTYSEWLEKQSEKVQNEVLGPTRAEYFRDGLVDVQNFVNDRGSVLTLDQLREVEDLPKLVSEDIRTEIEPLKTSSNPITDDWVAWKNELTDSQSTLVSDYCANTFYADDLRNAILGEGSARLKREGRLLMETLEQAPSYNGVVHRGIYDLTSKSYNKLLASEELVFDSIASATLRRDVAIEYALDPAGHGPSETTKNILFTIKQNNGKWIAPLSTNKAEQEVILMPGHTYKVVERIVRSHPSGAEYLELIMEEVR